MSAQFIFKHGIQLRALFVAAKANIKPRTAFKKTFIYSRPQQTQSP